MTNNKTALRILLAIVIASLLMAACSNPDLPSGDDVPDEIFIGGPDEVYERADATPDDAFPTETSAPSTATATSIPESADIQDPTDEPAEEIDSFDAHMQAGMDYYDSNNFDDAVAEFNDALKLQPENPEVFVQLARVHLQKLENDLAME